MKKYFFLCFKLIKPMSTCLIMILKDLNNVYWSHACVTCRTWNLIFTPHYILFTFKGQLRPLLKFTLYRRVFAYFSDMCCRYLNSIPIKDLRLV